MSPPDLQKRKRPSHHSGAPFEKLTKLSLSAAVSTPLNPPEQWVFPVRLQAAAEHLHALGPRALGALLLEIGNATDAMPLVMERASAYRQLTPEMLEATGGDRFPPRLTVVPSL
jgi:hypothetical protein